MPGLEAGNMLAKNMIFLGQDDAAGIVLGAVVPIILTSRADSVGTHMASIAVGALYAHGHTARRVATGIQAPLSGHRIPASPDRTDLLRLHLTCIKVLASVVTIVPIGTANLGTRGGAGHGADDEGGCRARIRQTTED